MRQDIRRLAPVSAFFALSGFTHGSWTPRLPGIVEQIGADVGILGITLTGSSIGMIIAASLAGRLCMAFGARRMLAASTLLVCLMLPLLGSVTTVVAFGIALVVLGLGIGLLDVAMNVAAAAMEQRLDRPVMSIFHAALPIGGVLASLAAALAAALKISPQAHLLVVGVVGLAVTLTALRAIPKDLTGQPKQDAAGRTGRAPFRLPALWLLAGVALCSVIAEGTAGKWSALFLVGDRGVSEGAAALAYTVFAASMMVARLFGEQVRNRWSAARILVCTSVIAAFGLLSAVLVPSALASYLGFALAGVGLAYAFPVALAMAGKAGRDNGGDGAREIGFVTTVAYCGSFAGSPLVGGIAQVSSLAVAFVVVGLLAALIGPLGASAQAVLGKKKQPEPTAR
ncbi:MFS transporter [Crossiella sp. NPDC003009]